MRIFRVMLTNVLWFSLQAKASGPDWDKIPKDGANFSQLIWVRPSTQIASKASLWQKSGGTWSQVGADFDVSLGRTGSIAGSLKKEGDGHTPEGLYPLVKVFGKKTVPDLKMPFVQIQDQDKWIDDPANPDYNHWVRGPTTAKSFEKLWRNDDLYEDFIVIGYNLNPVVRGAGSAIFFHVWRGPGLGTAGCVATPKDQLLKILKWLDPKMNPQIWIGP